MALLSMAHPNRKSPTMPTGFTLIEVVLVVAILGLFAALALPRFTSSTPAFRASLAAQTLAADLELLQSSARARSSSASLTLSSDGSSYTLTGLANPGQSSPLTRTIRLSDAPFFSSLDTTSLPSTTLTFDPTGLPSHSLTLILRSGNTHRQILITRLSNSILLQ